MQYRTFIKRKDFITKKLLCTTYHVVYCIGIYLVNITFKKSEKSYHVTKFTAHLTHTSSLKFSVGELLNIYYCTTVAILEG